MPETLETLLPQIPVGHWIVVEIRDGVLTHFWLKLFSTKGAAEKSILTKPKKKTGAYAVKQGTCLNY